MSLFLKVQKRMNAQRRGAAKATVNYLLSGIIYCGQCGGSIVGNIRRSGRAKLSYSNYECSSRKRKDTCSMKAVGKQYVENKVIDDLEKYCQSLGSLKQLKK